MITETALKRKDQEIALLREVEKAARAVYGGVVSTGEQRDRLNDALDAVAHFDANTETARQLAADLERMGVR